MDIPSPVQEEQEKQVVLDGKHYGVCPECGTQFDYDEEKDIGKVVRCRNCRILIRLVKKPHVPVAASGVEQDENLRED